MRLRCFSLAVTFTCTSAFALDDPFVGTWVYNAQKSPLPTIRYAIKDLGGGRHSLTGSTGITIEIKAEGVSVETLAGAPVSFKKLDENAREMVRDNGQPSRPLAQVPSSGRDVRLLRLRLAGHALGNACPCKR
jgi:hypothetical protein